jgi:peptidoglycan/LPS O-acetylase OafA/YrhL
VGAQSSDAELVKPSDAELVKPFSRLSDRREPFSHEPQTTQPQPDVASVCPDSGSAGSGSADVRAAPTVPPAATGVTAVTYGPVAVTGAPLVVTAAESAAHHLASIDGLRAIAVLAVVAYHFDLHLPGGFLGVDLFFAISGFVVARSLLRETQHSESTAALLKRFFKRRFWRLWPTLAVMVGITTLMSVVFSQLGFHVDSGPVQVAKHGFAALIGGANWFHLVTASNHPEQFRPLLHTWSLSIEEQFYVFLALTLMVGRRRAQMLSYVVAIGGLTVAALTSVFARSNAEQLFFSTPTRGAPIAMGVGLAGVSAGWSSWTRNRKSVVAFAAIMSSAFIGGAMLSAQWNGANKAWMFVVLSIPFVVIVAGAAYGVGAIQKVLRLKPIQEIGLRSYSIYLWHFPIVGWLAGAPTPIRLGVATILTALIAEVSYRWVERPSRAKGREIGGSKRRRSAYRTRRLSTSPADVSKKVP